MAHLQNWFGLLLPYIANILLWSESPDKPPDSNVTTSLIF